MPRTPQLNHSEAPLIVAVTTSFRLNIPNSETGSIVIGNTKLLKLTKNTNHSY